jgi:uncharacterized cupin superfamily protein
MRTTAGIQVEHQPSEARLRSLGVAQWPIWEKEISEFPWVYDEAETCYILAGQVTVTPDGGEPVTVGAGDLVTFPAGMACRWDISQPIRKHYRFG